MSARLCDGRPLNPGRGSCLCLGVWLECAVPFWAFIFRNAVVVGNRVGVIGQAGIGGSDDDDRPGCEGASNVTVWPLRWEE